ncbi:MULTISPECIES: hypothetical protein [Stenotrophomonas]|uniref:hypothetical protein n=1 Tax=Stenotrophomonas TaxID=40323 RepID=UPI001E65ADAE|nr:MULTISPECIES: hypothetical protein [Stenotrophomonas]
MRGCIAGGRAVLLGAVLCGLVGAAAAAEADAPVFDPWAADVLGSETFLASHPDMRYRKLGNEAMQGGRPEQARSYYRRGARYADKLSQAALAELLWNGVGGPADRAAAYAWMDLAAERGDRFLLVHRERYWAALDPAERDRALVEGQALYDTYGDAVAKPRQEREMRRGRNEVTGSRLGWIGALKMTVRGEDGQQQAMPVDRFLQDRYWEPAQYWHWQAQAMEQMQRAGTVEVGPATGVSPAE